MVSNCDLGSISVGDDFRFGKGRKGCVKLLKKFSKKYQFEVFEIERVKDKNGLVISSSRVREKLLESNFHAVSDLLQSAPSFNKSAPISKERAVVAGYLKPPVSVERPMKTASLEVGLIGNF